MVDGELNRLNKGTTKRKYNVSATNVLDPNVTVYPARETSLSTSGNVRILVCQRDAFPPACQIHKTPGRKRAKLWQHIPPDQREAARGDFVRTAELDSPDCRLVVCLFGGVLPA